MHANTIPKTIRFFIFISSYSLDEHSLHHGVSGGENAGSSYFNGGHNGRSNDNHDPTQPVSRKPVGFVRLAAVRDLPNRDKPTSMPVSALTSAIYRYDEVSEEFKVKGILSAADWVANE